MGEKEEGEREVGKKGDRIGKGRERFAIGRRRNSERREESQGELGRSITN